MAGFDAYLKAFAAIACVGFALVVLAGGRRRRGPLYLASFLFLIAGNQGAEALRALYSTSFEMDPGELVWFRIATLFAAFDPLLLYLFATAAEVEPRRRWPAYLIGSIATVLALSAFVLNVDRATDYYIRSALLSFTAIVYAIVLARFLRAVERDPTDIRARTLFIAASIGTVLPWIQLPPALASDVEIALGAREGENLFFFARWAGALAWPAAAIVIAGLVLYVRRRSGPDVARTAALGLIVGYFTAAALTGSSFATVLRMGAPFVPVPPWMEGVTILGRASAAVRWILFGALVSAAVLRQDMLGLSLARRRSAARAIVALAMLGAIGLAYAWLAIIFGPESVEFRPLDWFFLSLVLIATQGFRPLIDRVAARAYGVPMPADRSAAHDAYRRAVQQAVAEGRDVRNDPELSRLRYELSLGVTEAGVLERVVEEVSSGPLVAGQRVGGRYLVRRMIGRGGAGRVFLARDEMLDRDIVLKEVLHDEPEDEAGLREARAAGGLQHPNVVTVYDVIRRAGSSLLVGEYMPAGSLADRIQERGPMPLAEGVRFLDGVLGGLEAVHARGLVHRDLKPQNVLFDAHGVPKIADFGIARARRGVTAGFDEPDAFIGTPEFMAPEQRAGVRATAATDVHSLARIARNCIEQPLPAAMEAVISKAMADDPQARYANAGEMRSALREATRELRVGVL